MTLPNFIVVGAAKAGTTSVYSYAAQHPDVFMSPVKETNYFALYGEPPAFQGPGDRTLINRTSVHERDRYEHLFDGAAENAVGEASPRYLNTAPAAQRIRRDIPDCRLIVGLRQPADRAFAAWTWSRMSGRETLGFVEAIAEGAERKASNWSWGRYIEVGFYADQIERYLDLFPKDRIHVYIYDDLATDAVAVMQGIFRFLEVDPNFVPDTSHRHNRSGVIASPVLRNAWDLSSGVRDLLRPLWPERLRGLAYRWIMRNARKPPFDAELRGRLTAQYRDDIVRTQDLIGRDLGRWLVT